MAFNVADLGVLSEAAVVLRANRVEVEDERRCDRARGSGIRQLGSVVSGSGRLPMGTIRTLSPAILTPEGFGRAVRISQSGK